MPKFQSNCKACADGISWLTTVIGKAVAWLILVLTVITTLIVIVRTVFNAGTVGTQESLTYMHALVITLASAYTFKVDGHVRVDIFYRKFSTLQKAWVNALGCSLLLLPLALFTVTVSWSYVASAWSVLEASADSGGIPAVFLLKSLLLVSGILLALQAFAEIARNLIPMTYIDSQYKENPSND